MTNVEREKYIAHYSALMRQAWDDGKRAEARLYCRIHAGLIRGRSPEVVRKMEKERGVA